MILLDALLIDASLLDAIKIVYPLPFIKINYVDPYRCAPPPPEVSNHYIETHSCQFQLQHGNHSQETLFHIH